jgi:hypothetical protein
MKPRLRWIDMAAQDGNAASFEYFLDLQARSLHGIAVGYQESATRSEMGLDQLWQLRKGIQT